MTEPTDAMGAHPEQRLRELGLTLPAPPPAMGRYELAVRSGSLLFLAGTRRCVTASTATSARSVAKLLGMVNCTEDFTRLPDVMNGASDLLIEVFGEAGRHARSAVGMQQLHYGMAVEIDGIVEIAG